MQTLILNFMYLTLIFGLLPSLITGFPPVYLQVWSTDRIEILSTRQTNDNPYNAFQKYYPNDLISNHIVANGIGMFLNISYANLFLRISIDHGMMYVVSD